MTTNFFENIASLQVSGIWKIGIHTDENGQFVVSALFTAQALGDSATKAISPLIHRGTAQEMDNGFFEAIVKPVQETAGFYASTEEYLKNLEKARLASKQEQDRINAEKKAKALAKPKEEGEGIELAEPKISKEEKKKLYDDALKSVNELRGLMKYAEALELLPTKEDYPEKATELNKLNIELNRLKNLKEKQNTIFND
jgi:hypothetical protein